MRLCHLFKNYVMPKMLLSAAWLVLPFLLIRKHTFDSMASYN
jgi:hypothetical protein